MNDYTTGGPDPKRLQRSLVDRRIGGVCGGLARYLETDPAIIRVLWLVLTAAGLLGLGVGIFLGIFAYIACWLIVPEAAPGSEPIIQGARRLQRSATNSQLAGVCGGLAEYFSVDANVVRVLWVLLTLCTLVVGGLLIYLAAWIIMPLAAAPAAAASAPGAEAAPATAQATAAQAGAGAAATGTGMAADTPSADAGSTEAAAPGTDSTASDTASTATDASASTTDAAAEEPRT